VGGKKKDGKGGKMLLMYSKIKGDKDRDESGEEETTHQFSRKGKKGRTFFEKKKRGAELI